MGERLGLLGGTFDPPHVGHAIVAVDVYEALDLDRLLLVPAGDPPHRRAAFPASVRYDLLRTLFDELAGFEVSDLELRRPGASYTVETLEQVRHERRPSDLYCIMGADQFRLIRTWHRYEEIADLAHLVVMTRGGEAIDGDLAEAVPHIRIEVTRVDVSGTRIRARLREGRSVRFLVPEPIRAEVERAWREEASRAGNESPGDAY